MSIGKCTSGNKSAPEFDIELVSGQGKFHPYLVFLLPEECWPEDYPGDGCFTFDFESVLKEWLGYHIQYDGGKRTNKTISLLRKYADLLEISLTTHTNKGE